MLTPGETAGSNASVRGRERDTVAAAPPPPPRKHQGNAVMAGGYLPHSKRSRRGVLINPLSRELYQMAVRQLHHDGFLAAASAVCDATGVTVDDVEGDGDRLFRVVRAGLSVEEMERNAEVEFQATQVVERFLSASKLYMPLSLSNRWSMGSRCVSMRERFVSASLGGVVRDISFSPDGAYITCAGTNGVAALFSLETLEDLCSLNEVRTSNLKRSPPEHYGAAAKTKGEPVPGGVRSLNVNEVTELAMVRRFSEHTQSVEVMRFHPREPVLLSGGYEGDVYLRNYAYPDSKVLMKVHDTFAVRSAAFHPSGEYLVIATDHHLPRLINVRTEKVLTPPGTYVSSSTHASGDGDEDGSSAASTYCSTDFGAQHTAALTSVCFAPDGRTMVSTSLDGSWMLYDGVTGRVIYKSQNAHSSVSVTSAVYSRTGNVVLTAGMDSTARLWDLRRLSTTLRNNDSPEVQSFGEPVKCRRRSIRAAFSANESHVFCQDSSLLAIQRYCVYTGEVVATLTTQPSFEQHGLAASPYSNFLITGGDDSRLHLWTPTWLPP